MDFAQTRLRRLASDTVEPDADCRAKLDRLLAWPGAAAHGPVLQAALLDPFFPLAMMQRTLFAHVTGMRFYIHKDRPDLQPMLLRDLSQFARAFLEIRRDLAVLYPCRPPSSFLEDGAPTLAPFDQWCDLCGQCCQIGGVPAQPPESVCYPDSWRDLLEGTRLDNQQLCPFLFQYRGSQVHFCAIHRIKPVACRSFDADDCRARRRDGFLHDAGSPM
uniref:YkgJ family cysteine cluster protein n=1 Tax=Desulfacinum infernum TaxID=35837 RepID=A0A832EJE4_9BACT